MNRYIQLVFNNISSAQSDILIAELNEAGYEGFEEQDDSLKAFIAAEAFNETLINDITKRVAVIFSKTIIEETNWNQVWESNFQPVVVGKFAGIRADFHPPIQGVAHEILITPKMSFGTGHHATTHMMIEQMKDISFTNRTVLDFGTGTGILAILSEKLGAAGILAIDHDQWSIENAGENMARNACSRVTLHKADSAASGKTFDIILANINKNVILDNFLLLTKQLSRDGVLIISGLLAEDETDILKKAREIGLRLGIRLERHNWLCLSLSY